MISDALRSSVELYKRTLLDALDRSSDPEDRALLHHELDRMNADYPDIIVLPRIVCESPIHLTVHPSPAE